MLSFNLPQAKIFLEKMLAKNYKYEEMQNVIPNDSFELNFGFSVVLELFEVMKFYFLNYVKTNKSIADSILNEIEKSLFGFIKLFEISQLFKDKKIVLDSNTFKEFFELKLKRLPATVMVLADLAFSEEVVDAESLNCFVAMGRTLEIQITLLRDFKRYEVS